MDLLTTGINQGIKEVRCHYLLQMKLLLILLYFTLGAHSDDIALRHEQLLQVSHESLEYQQSTIRNPIWVYDCVGEKIIKVREINKDTITASNLTKLLNRNYENQVRIELVQVKQDSVLVTIPNSTFLTQSMGTTGAEEYLIEAVFTLTELPGIEFVEFEFEEGDHATPGVYSRKLLQEQVDDRRK